MLCWRRYDIPFGYIFCGELLLQFVIHHKILVMNILLLESLPTIDVRSQQSIKFYSFLVVCVNHRMLITVAQKCHGNFNFVHGNFNFTTAISTSFTAISTSSRQFQFHHGNFNFVHGNFFQLRHGNFNFTTAISTSFTAISILSRQFQLRSRQFQFYHRNFFINSDRPARLSRACFSRF